MTVELNQCDLTKNPDRFVHLDCFLNGSGWDRYGFVDWIYPNSGRNDWINEIAQNNICLRCKCGRPVIAVVRPKQNVVV